MKLVLIAWNKEKFGDVQNNVNQAVQNLEAIHDQSQLMA